MELKDVALLIRGGEGLFVEFKERYTSRIDEDIVAFANTKGGAILLGVRDGGTLAGERLTNDLKGRITSLARNCKPAIHVEMAQAGGVVAVEVPEGVEKPYSCGSGYFRRLNGSTQKMGHEEIRIMFRENDPFPFEERPAKGFAFDGLSRAKVLAFAREAGVNIGKTTTADFLRSLKVADETSVKNAGILFFAKDPHEHIRQAQMTLVAFKGTKKGLILDRRDVRDDLFTQFREAVVFLERHLNVRSEIRGYNRVDILEIPPAALREAVVNALVHRDYSITGTQVSVEVFDDRVEITNPGGLPKGLSQKSFGKGISIRRNELIADLFFRLDKVERVGQGIQRMKDAMADAGLKEPEFDANGFFRAVFHRSPEFSLAPGTQKGSQKSTQKGSQKILALIAERCDVTIAELAVHLRISPRAVKKHLRKLKARGLLRRVGPDRGGRWDIPPTGNRKESQEENQERLEEGSDGTARRRS
ncbi:MAG: putative DNA binding domain-containing protein [Elusimicrobia bacterium]|nr:putative DNA binding domain-containing protein [Elusimicrobiota bacterium]